MTEELTPPATTDPEPASTHDAAHESLGGELELIRERLDDVEATAGAALMMHLEDDEEAEPERTEVEERHEPPAEEKKEPAETPASGDKHAGLFL